MTNTPPDKTRKIQEQSFVVGGAVRDQILGIESKDRDWVVVGATPEDMLAAGFKQVGADFPVFLHPVSNEEYALARTERKQGRGYHGFICDFGPDIKLESDLERRDLTINAMALNDAGEVIDPYHGLKDIESRTLRHVSTAFCEDPLRVLRVARFAARFKKHGFIIAEETLSLMQDMVNAGELEELTAERVWQETARAIQEESAWVFIEVLKQCGALAIVMPELDALFGVPQPEKYHPEIDCGLHALLSLKAACSISDSVEVRFAALIHDLGKGLTPKLAWPAHHGHEKKGLKPIKQLCSRLKTSRRVQTIAMLASEYHTHVHRAFELRAETLLKVIKACDSFRKPDVFEDMLLVCIADARGRTGFEQQDYPQADYFREALALVCKLDIAPLLDQGLKGKELGTAIDSMRVEALRRFKNQYTPATS